jgi:hypothetical protein
LFAGKLPGQKDRAVYLTHGHFMELDRQLRDAAQTLRDKAATGRRGAKAERPRERGGAIEAEMTRLIEADALEQAPGLDRYRLTRETAHKLVIDDADVGAAQLMRISSGEISERLLPFAQLYRPGPDDQAAIERDARDWRERFDDEVNRRGPDAPTRSRGSLRNDALSLALILWVVQLRSRTREMPKDPVAPDQKPPDERIVLVTGDSVMFSAYRRWYVNQNATQPFVLRRLTQYSPIINLNDAASDVSGHRELFERTRIATEAALFMFNLGPKSRGTLDDPYVSSGRDDLAVRLADLIRLLELREDEWKRVASEDKVLPFFTPALRRWLPENGPALKQLGSGWQSLERFAVGVNHDLVMRRAESTASAREAVAAWDEGATEVYLSYVESSLATLTVGGLRLMFPFVTEFLVTAAALNEFDDGAELRVPITLRLTVPASDDGQHVVRYEVQDLLRRIHDRDPDIIRILDLKQNGRLEQQPQLVYALAAALALRVGHWPEAERFSELAMPVEPGARSGLARPRLSAADRAEADAVEAEDFEFLYLAAVAKRFRMGSRSPWSWHAREDIWLRYLNGAVPILDRCERHHAIRGQIVRETRAISERAAVRLFYVSWAAITPPDIRERCNFDAATALREFRLGLDDLRKCVGLELAARDVGRGDAVRRSFFERIEKQYTVNLAAAHILSRLLTASRGEPVDGLQPEERGQLVERLARWTTPEGGLPTVALTDVYAFLALERQDRAATARLLESSEHRARLPLDREILETVRRYLRAPPPDFAAR